ncbi:hypothetical protein O0L34_g16821 [Tuta absoluta]|nr:hypothetical protein O0L34_g16821 [Tuta absoluta]
MPKQRKRSEMFSAEESLILVKLVEKYKKYILNKATNAAANHNKDVAWRKIAAEFNHSNGLPIKRNPKVLKVRWENITKKIKKLKSIGVKEPASENEPYKLDEIYKTIAIKLIWSEDVFYNTDDVIEDDISNPEIDDNGSEQQKDVGDSDESVSDDGNEQNKDANENSCSSNKGQNFSANESKLLIECVKREKKHVFSKNFTSKAIEAKNQAWSRIADSYNKLSPQKRSVKCLRMKFKRIKFIAQNLNYEDDVPKFNIGNKHEKLINDSFESIKQEPITAENMDDDSLQFSDQDDNNMDNVVDNVIGRGNVEANAADPLAAVLNGGDSGIGSTSSQLASWNWHHSDNKEIIKLEKELLSYQMETAMLERKRLEELMAEEAIEREARATERALRLRAARLDAVSAASRLPPSHPAAQYRPEEARAAQYLSQYQQL